MQNFDLHKYLGNNPLLEDENSNSEDFFNSLTEEQLQEATAWENIKFALSKLGRYKAGGKIRGKKELDKKEIARIEALLDKSANNQIKIIKKTIDKEFEGFPNNKEQNVFIDGVLEIAKVYDSIKAETESGKIPVDAGNVFIEELKEYVKDILDRQLKAVYSVTNENQELEEKVTIDPDANPKDIATLKFKPVKDAIKSGELTPYETERIKTLKSWSLPLKLVLTALSAAGLGWLFDAVSGGEEEITVETLKKFSEVVGEIEPGEGMTQVFNRVYDTSFDINSDPQELADFIKNTIGGGNVETAINNLTNNGAEGVGGIFTEGDEAKETLKAFMADPDGKGDTLKDVFNGDWTGDGKTATDTLDTLTGNKLVGIVTKIVLKTVIISTAKYTMAKSVLGGIGAGLAVGAAAVAISRYKGRKSSRAQVLNDLFQYLRPIAPTKSNPEILDVKVAEPKKVVKTKTVVSKPSKDNFDNMNRNNQIAVILSQINPSLDIYNKLESEGIESDLVSDIKDIRGSEKASQELKKLAALILTIRKNPNSFLKKVSQATGIKFDTRAKAKMQGAGKKGESAAKLGLSESVLNLIREGIIDDMIQNADLETKSSEILALLGSMYKSTSQKDGKRLSILNIDELEPKELEKIKGLGFSTKDKSGRYIFMDSEEEVGLEKVKGDSKKGDKKVNKRIQRAGNFLDKKPNLKRKFKLIDRNIEVAPIILGIFLALPDKLKKKSIILKMINKMIQDDRLKTLDDKEEVKEATNRKATQDVINALDIFDDYDQLKVSLSQLLNQDEVIDVFFDEFLPEMPGITRGELEYALKQIKMELNNVKGEDAKDIESAFSGLGITQKGEKEKEIETPTWSASQEVNYTLTEGLTEDESKAVLDKYKQRYAAVLKSNPDFIKKYPNPDKVIYGMVMNEVKKLKEKLGKNADLGDHIEDFTNSDAPQFQGKSKKKIKQMATAAFLNKEEQKLDEIDAMMEDAQEKSEKNYSNYFKKMDKNRLNELVKAALMGPISEKQASTDKYDNNPGLKGNQSKLPDALQKGILGLEEDNVDETNMANKLAKNIADIPNFLHKLIKDLRGLKNKDGSPITTSQIISQLRLKMTPAEVEAIKEAIKEDKVKSLTERIFNELREGKIKLTPPEQKIVDDITESLNEGVLDFEKIKQYAKKGLMTAAILLSLNATGFSTDQQQKISDIVKTEMPASKKTEVDRMHKISVVTTALQQYKRGKKLDQLDDSLKQDLEDIKNGPKDVDQVVNIFDFHQDALKKYVPFMF